MTNTPAFDLLVITIECRHQGLDMDREDSILRMNNYNKILCDADTVNRLNERYRTNVRELIVVQNLGDGQFAQNLCYS